MIAPSVAHRLSMNRNRLELSRRHGSRRWSYKGVLTRLFGQGIQRVFQAIPAMSRAAISGSMGLAVYDMAHGKRDLNWVPNDVDIFVALSQHQRKQPLAELYPIMATWLRSVQNQGFLYKLKKGGACYSKAMCIFDFECTNASAFPQLHLPKISFIGRPAKSVREICNEFDLSICGPILHRCNQESPIGIHVTNEIRYLVSRRQFYSNILPTRRTRKGRQTYYRIQKYQGREFRFFHANYHQPALVSGKFPNFPTFYFRHKKPVCKQFIIASLGREPTLQESRDFNIEL